MVAEIRYSPPRQTGAAVLGTVLVLMFVFGISAVFATQQSVLEQRMSYTDARLLEARLNAQNGLNNTAYVLSRAALESNGEDQFVISDIRYSIEINTVAPGDFEKLQLNSTGYADNRQIQQTVTQRYEYRPFIHYAPKASITSHADVLLGHNIAISTTGNSKPVWSGGNANTVLDETLLVSNDAALRQLDHTEFFANFLSLEPDSLQQFANVIDCVEHDCGYEAITTHNKPTWLKGTLVLDHDLGTSDQPVLLFVEGSLKFTNNARFTGVIVMLNDWREIHLAGEISGGVIVSGTTELDGILEIDLDRNVIERLQTTMGFYVPIPGSWHDRA